MTTPARGRRAAAAVVALGLCLSPALTATAAPVAAVAKKPVADTSLSAALDAMVDDTYVVGVVGAVTRDGRTVSDAAGVRDLRSMTPARPQDRAHIASVTKPMVSTLVFQEIERGTWTLDTTIGEVLPGLWPGHEDVTVGQLLNHSSGMPDAIWSLLDNTPFYELTPEQVQSLVSVQYSEERLVEIARQMGWYFEPGTNQSYSNTGYAVVSLMLEAQNDTSIERLIRDRVFRPAGMHQSRLENSTRIRGRFLQDYGTWDGQKVRIDVNNSIFSGAGAVIAPADDVNAFWKALVSGRLISASSLRTMWTVQPQLLEAGSTYAYGVYWMSVPCAGGPVTVVGHDGAGFGTETLSFTTPDGRTQATMAWTGRTYDADTYPPVDAFLTAAFCPVSGGAKVGTANPAAGTAGGLATRAGLSG